MGESNRMTTIGLDNTGFLKFDMDIEMGDKNVFNTTGSKLWTRVQLLFKNELEEQYSLMRQKQFTIDNMMKYIVDEQIGQIPAKFYNIDMQTKYLNYGSSYLYALHGSGKLHIRKWLRERLIYCDTLFGYNVSTSDYITLRSSKLGEVYLDIQTYIPMYVRIKWRDEANNTGVQVKRVARGETVRFTYTMPTATDQEIIVYAGYYLKSLGDVSNLQPTSMLIANAKRLTEITCHSPNLINTDLSECTMLQRIDLSNSSILGTGIGAQPILNIQNCKYLRYCNCTNTQLTAIYTMQQGGNLEELYFPETTQVVQVANQTYLHTLGIPYPRDGSDNYCKNLATVQITNCNAIKYIQYPYIEDEGLKFESLKYVQNLSITNSMPTLTSMSFRGFNKLKNITLSNLPNLATLGFDNMLNASDISTFKTMTLSNLPKVTKITFNVDSNNYKIAFAGAGKIDIGGLQSVTTIESNYSIKGLDTIILPTSIKELRFSTTYGDGINELKNLWSATSNHASDGFTGIDFQDMTINFIDMLGLSQVSNAINFNIAPIDQHPNMNTNRDGTATKPYFKPTGTINLNNYTGSMVNMLKGVDLSRLTVILDNEKSQTDLTSLFQGATIVEADKTKINNILSKFPYSTIWDYMFAYVNIPNLEGINIGAGKMSLKGWAKGSSITADITIPANVYVIDEMFMGCLNLTHIKSNWNNNYTYTTTTTNCYNGCVNLLYIDYVALVINEYSVGLDEVPSTWGGYGFSKNYTSIYVVVIPTDNYNIDMGTLLDDGLVNWGDGQITKAIRTHIYAKAGTYTIKGKVVSNVGVNYPYTSLANTLVRVNQVAHSQNTTPKNCFTNCVNLTSINLRGTKLVGNTMERFANGCSNLTEILTDSETSFQNVTSFVNAFDGCVKLQRFDFSLLATGNKLNLGYAFYNCKVLVIDNFNSTIKATTMSNCFYNNLKINSVNFTNWDFSECTDWSSAFQGCTDLVEIIGVNSINMSKNTSLSNMFNGCINLVSLDVSSWDTSNVAAMNDIFSGCVRLTSIRNNWNCKSAWTIGGMFANCPLLALNFTFDFTGNARTNVNITRLFRDSPKIRSLNLIELQGISAMEGLLTSVSDLTTITNFPPYHMTDSGWSGIWNTYGTNIKTLDVTFVGTFNTGDETLFNKGYWEYSYTKPTFTPASLVNLFNHLATVTTTQNLQIGSNNLAVLTAEQKAIATNKGWTLS